MKSLVAFSRILLFLVTLVVASLPSSAQTLTLNDSSIVQSKTNRIGMNIAQVNYWDSGQLLKNLIGSLNPGFEPLIDREIWVLNEAGTTSSFTEPNGGDNVAANYWAGGTFSVVESQSAGAELGCTGTIASNTGGGSPQFTSSSMCAAPFRAGDIVVLTKSTFPTPEAWWEGGYGGTWGSVSGGAQLLSDTTDLCATCGTQSLNMNAAAAGSSATATWYFDAANSQDLFVLMNGNFQLSFWAKAGSGTPTLTASASRMSAGGFNCGTYTPKLTNAWTEYTFTCTASETPSTAPGMSFVSLKTVGGSVYLDNVSFMKTSSPINNPTVFRDEVIETLQRFYGNAAGAPAGKLRYWLEQNGQTVNNWTQPDYAAAPTTTGSSYFVSPNGGGMMLLSLEDYLVICQFLNVDPYLEVPVTFSSAEAADLIEFLGSPAGTTYGARRAALGQVEPWTEIFDKIHLSFCNECWNSTFTGENLPWRANTPNSEVYYDYSSRARDIFSAMRADTYYSSSAFDLVMNAQTAVNWSMDTAIQRAHPDSIEINGYVYNSVNSFATDSALWQPAMVQPYEQASNPADPANFYQSVHDYQSQKTCGAQGNAACNVNIYEWGQNTLGGGIDQAHMDYINAGAGQGVIAALEPLLNLQYYGILSQSFFGLSQFSYNTNGKTAKLWGSVVDMGGATNNQRPQFLALSLVNQSIIGPMFSCPLTNNPAFNFAGSTNGPVPAVNNVSYLYAFCFENGNNRSLVLLNTDLVNNHTINLAGANLPAGSVTKRQYAPAALDQLNEAPTGENTSTAPAPVAVEISTLSSPASIVLPPFSVTAIDYSIAAATVTPVATPTFSSPAGTYTSSQSVTISDSTPGATIYYTVNGSAPSITSQKYTGAIALSATATLQAIAAEAGYNTSPTASATYVIKNTPQPAVITSPASGSTLTSSSVTFTWSSGTSATEYALRLGTSGVGSNNLWYSPVTMLRSVTVNGLPTNGATIYARLYSLVNGTWQPVDTTYKAQ